MSTKSDRWKSLRVRPRTHQKFKKLAARQGSSIETVASALVDAALQSAPHSPPAFAPPMTPLAASHPNPQQQLDSLIQECSAPNWDGHGAHPITPSTQKAASRFLKSLRPHLPPPSLGAEPDGSITFEWHQAPRQTLSVSIGPDANLHYAALLGPRKQYGTEPFSGTLPSVIERLISQIISDMQTGAA